MHKVFISYHHANDQWAKDALIAANKKFGLFIDGSVDLGDISDVLPSESIRRIIRDEYLQDSSVTILLVGTETAKRKHIDWELYSSMYDGAVNKKSGIVVVQLPSTNPQNVTITNGDIEKSFYPGRTWNNALKVRDEYERLYPYFPERILDNLENTNCRISVTTWDCIWNDLGKLVQLIDWAYEQKSKNLYDLSRKMMDYNRR